MKEYEKFLELAKAELILVNKIMDDKEIRDELKLFHVQQVVEKAIKAILSYKSIVFPKTHDIENLIELSLAEGIHLPDYVERFPELTMFAVEFRYGFLDEAVEDIYEVIELTKKFVGFVEEYFSNNC